MIVEIENQEKYLWQSWVAVSIRDAAASGNLPGRPQLLSLVVHAREEGKRSYALSETTDNNRNEAHQVRCLSVRHTRERRKQERQIPLLPWLRFSQKAKALLKFNGRGQENETTIEASFDNRLAHFSELRNARMSHPSKCNIRP